MKIKNYLVLIFTLLLSLSSQLAYANSLHQAKSEGWIGEQNNGYIGFVTPGSNDAIKQLVAEVNSKRRALYARLGSKQNLTLGQVEIVAAERNAKKTASGNYFQDGNGNWIKKK